MNNQEHKVDIRDLLAECIRKWWVIVGAVLICAIVFAGFKYYQDCKAIEYATEQSQSISVSDTTDFSEKEMLAIKLYAEKLKEYEKQKEYVEKSIYISLDENHVYSMYTQYYIAGDGQTTESGLNMAYNDFVLYGTFAESLSEQLGIEVYYLKELYAIAVDTKGLSENFFVLRVFGKDEEMCQQIMNVANELLLEYSQNLSDASCSHELIAVTQSSGFVRRDVILNARILALETLENLRFEVNELKTTLSEEQILAAEVMAGLYEQSNKTQGQEVNVSASISLKALILGSAFGCIVALVCIYLIYVFKNKIKVSDDIKANKVFVFGGVTIQKPSFLQKLTNVVSGNQYAKTEYTNLTLAKIVSMCNKEEVKKVYVSIDKRYIDVPKLIEVFNGLSEQGIEVDLLNTITTDTESIGKIKGHEAILLTSVLHKTSISDFKMELEFFAEYECDVLGCVLVQ